MVEEINKIEVAELMIGYLQNRLDKNDADVFSRKILNELVSYAFQGFDVFVADFLA